MRKFDKFTRVKSPVLAGDVSLAVQRNAELLQVAKPQVLTDHASPWDAFNRIRAVAKAPNVVGYALRPDGVVRGIAQISLRETVHHTAFGNLTGNRVDYWLEPGVDEDVRLAMAQHLVTIAARDGSPVFSAMTPSEQELAPELGQILPAVGHLGQVVLQPPQYSRGEPLQLFTNRRG